MGHAEGKVTGRSHGKTETQAEAVLKIVARRKLAMTARQQHRIVEYAEFATLFDWIDRAHSVESVDQLLGEMHVEWVLERLRKKSRRYWPAKQRRAYDEGVAKGFAEARAREEASALLMLLAHRGLPTMPRQRRKIRECTDLATLARWFDRMGSVRSVEDLFGERRAPVR